ncbi:hypothetical protein [Bacillus sp. OTU530]|uniref:hypothetical protein n=1 Tax=Bacillus sp. OTU530 TaxID=3043862 RepID=UPI00313CA861
MKNFFLLLVFLSIFAVGCSFNQTSNSNASVQGETETPKKLATLSEITPLVKVGMGMEDIHKAEDKLKENSKHLREISDGYKLSGDIWKAKDGYLVLFYEANVVKEIKTFTSIDELNSYVRDLELAAVQQKTVDTQTRTWNPQPVSIGMTKEEVLTEGWGQPNKINRTTTANGVSEQWVYAGYRYLYFDETGTLVTIQD